MAPLATPLPAPHIHVLLYLFQAIDHFHGNIPVSYSDASYATELQEKPTENSLVIYSPHSMTDSYHIALPYLMSPTDISRCYSTIA